jgi:hypothetical protein
MSRAPISIAAIAGLIALAVAGRVDAQRGGGAATPPLQPPRAAAPIDLTGYWVSIKRAGLAVAHGDPPKVISRAFS